jgi:hypothetical protein
MGYTCVDGEIVIVPEQAEVARKIFENIFGIHQFIGLLIKQGIECFLNIGTD